MAKEQFSIKEAFRYAWETFKQNWQLFLVISIINAVVNTPQNRINRESANEPILTIISLIFAVISIIISIGQIKVTLRVYDKEKPEVLDIFRYTRYFWRFLGAGILYGLLVAAGFILLIVPGIIWAIKYSMIFNLIVDRDMGIMEAFKKSGELTDGVKWQLFLFGLASLGVIILGAIALGVGILVAMPITWIAGVYVYRHLLR